MTKLGKHKYDESIGEMKDADELINRILFLDGLPNVQRLNPIGVGEDVEQILRADLALAEKALGDLREGITYCASVRDFVSRDLLLKILGREEEHVDFLERPPMEGTREVFPWPPVLEACNGRYHTQD